MSALLLLLLILGFFIGALWSERDYLLMRTAQFLTVSDTLEPAGLIVVLSGEISMRPPLAVELYLMNFAPKILLFAKELSPAEKQGLIPEQASVVKDYLISQGVSADDIVIPQAYGRVTSTYDEALQLKQYCLGNRIDKVILVTSFYHSRRASWIFQKILEGDAVKLMTAPSPSWRFNCSNWWKTEAGLISIFNEYAKFFYYLLKY